MEPRTPDMVRLTAEAGLPIDKQQLHRWQHSGLLVPSVEKAQGSGTRRVYSGDDLVTALAIGALLRAGFTLTRIRDVAPDLAGLVRAGAPRFGLTSPHVSTVVDLKGLRDLAGVRRRPA